MATPTGIAAAARQAASGFALRALPRRKTYTTYWDINHLQQVVRAARLAAAAIEHGEALMAAVSSAQAMQSAWLAETTEARTMIAAGVKSTRKGDLANAQRSDDAKAQAVAWQTEADELWKANGALSNSDVAKRIDPARWDYIRKVIIKPPN